jgi:hypothetical protein
MTTTIWMFVLSLADSPGVVPLLRDDDEYRKHPAAAVVVDGVVERTPTTGRPGGTTRFNVFRLRFQDALGKEDVRELFVKDHAFRVSSFLTKKVRVEGKLIETKVGEATMRELWAASIQPLTGPLALMPGPDGVFSRSEWQPEEARTRGARQYVFRTPEQVAVAMRVTGASSATTASGLLARRLQVPAIDWDKQMVICVSAGLQGDVESLTITSVKEQGGVLWVRFRLRNGKGGGFGYPAQTALVRRTTAEVRFEKEANAEKPVE